MKYRILVNDEYYGNESIGGPHVSYETFFTEQDHVNHIEHLSN